MTWILSIFVSLLAAQPPTDPVKQLEAWLKLPVAKRPTMSKQPFANEPLSKAQATQARKLLVQDDLKQTRKDHEKEWKKRQITLGQFTMKFEYKVFGAKPAIGRSLYISMHGGGNSGSKVNDEQWNNQKRLYEPAEGVYLAPRAPNDAWDMWFQPHIDDFFERIIQDAVVFEDVNPNKVYLMGYSAGGDGVFRMAPRLADRWAAAAMMAGHPGDVRAENLRNLPFTLHMGEKDSAYERNVRAAEWKKILADLHEKDPEGYVHEVVIQPGMKHWMNRKDAVAVPWMAKFTRNTMPKRVVWLQPKRNNFYWLAQVKESTDKKLKPSIIAEIQGQTIQLSTEHVTELMLRFRDELIDLDKPIIGMWNGKKLFEGKVTRTIGTLYTTLRERHDADLCFSAELKGEFPR